MTILLGTTGFLRVADVVVRRDADKRPHTLRRSLSRLVCTTIRRHDAPWHVENDKSFVAGFGQAMERDGDADEPSDERTEDRGRSGVKKD